MDLSIDPHIAVALCCIMIALLVTFVLLVDIASNRGRPPGGGSGHRKK